MEITVPRKKVPRGNPPPQPQDWAGLKIWPPAYGFALAMTENNAAEGACQSLSRQRGKIFRELGTRP
jgi:hypothetical protein